MKLINSEKQL